MTTQKPPLEEQFEKLSHVASKLLDEADPDAAIRLAKEMSALLDEIDWPEEKTIRREV